jgi:hypothetical protein
MSNFSKPSSIQREINFVILFNDKYEKMVTMEKKDIDLKNSEKVFTIPGTKESEIVNNWRNFKQFMVHYPEPEKEYVKIENNLIKMNEIKTKLENNKNYIIENRFANKKDLFKEIKRNYDFCELNQSYIYKHLEMSDFIIFINNLEKVTPEQPYSPLCMAIINIYEDSFTSYENETIVKKYLYISVFCSDINYGECGRYLMNSIKYIAYLLGCSEIRLESVRSKNTLNFYKKNKFNNINENETFYYDNYYIVTDKDAEYKSLPSIEGVASYISPPKELIGGKNKKTRNNIIKKYNKKNKSKKIRNLQNE